MALQLKRAYIAASKRDGVRVLVDRLWPRGITKAALKYDSWPKEIAPSNELRKAFGHKAENWKSFQRDYKKELQRPEAKEKLIELAKIAKKKTVTLLYAARDQKMNHAVVLKSVIEKI